MLSNQKKVLAITKRTAELCGTQALLYRAGFELVTATNIATARSLIRALRIKAVIICRHSWTDEERDTIVSDLMANHPEVAVILRCPGCTGCDEATDTPGTLSDTLPLTRLVGAITPIANS